MRRRTTSQALLQLLQYVSPWAEKCVGEYQAAGVMASDARQENTEAFALDVDLGGVSMQDTAE